MIISNQSHFSDLGQVAEISTGKLDSNAAIEDGEYPFFTCAPETLAIDQYAFDTEAVLLAGNNASGKFNVKYYNGKFNAYQRTYVIKPKEKDKLDCKYLMYVLAMRLAEMERLSIGSTTRFLTRKILDKFEIPLPSISIQQHIASNLSGIDKAIEQAGIAIEESERMKRGLMQKLMNGSFESISKKYELKPFSDCFTTYQTNSYSRDKLTYENGEIKNIHYGDIHKHLPVITNLQSEKLPYLKEGLSNSKIKLESFCRDGDIIMADTAEDYEGVGKSIELVGVADQKVVSGLHTYLCRDESHIFHDGFRGYLLNSPFVHNQIMKYAAGMKVYSITKINLSKILLPCPPRKEQQNITNVFSCMDKIIGQNKHRKSLLETLKRGMMQQLLAGANQT